jgi:hypothetical protein
VIDMAAVSSIKHHDIHGAVNFLNKSSHSVLKGSFFVIEGIVGFLILVSVLVFAVVFISFLLNAILF